jgi:hypothetical protein
MFQVAGWQIAGPRAHGLQRETFNLKLKLETQSGL